MKRLPITYILTFLLIVFFSCGKEEYKAEGLPWFEDPGEGLFLSLAVSDDNSETRAISNSTDEKAIKDLYAVYFKDSICTGYQNLNNPVKTSSGIMHYQLTGYPTGNNIDILFVANLGVHKTPGNYTWINEPLDSVSKKILFLQIERADSVWATDKTGKQYIPMYTHAKKLKIPVSLPSGANYIKDDSDLTTQITETNAQVYNLTRMVAKIEIENHQTNLDAGNEKLVIDSVWVANTHQKGFMCYYGDTWNSTYNRLTKPTLFDMKKVGGGRRIVYHKPSISLSNNIQKLVFYLFETGVVVEDDIYSQSNCHIVLKGTKGTEITQQSYLLYIPALTGTGSNVTADMANPGPVLRNYNYHYTINGVTTEKVLQVTVNVEDWQIARIPVTMWN